MRCSPVYPDSLTEDRGTDGAPPPCVRMAAKPALREAFVDGSDELRRQIEELALRLVVGESDRGGAPAGPAWAASVARIRECALREQAVAVADAAAGLLDTLGGAQGGLASAELQEGVARLQQALHFAPEAAKATMLAPAQDPELLADFVLESREH